MKNKGLKVVSIIIVGISAVIIFAIATTYLGPKLTFKYKEGTPEEAIAYAFQLQNYPDTEINYIIENDVIFAVTLEPDKTSRAVSLARDENGRYSSTIDELLSMGESMYSLGFNATDAGAVLYRKDGKYIIDIPIQGYSFLEEENMRKTIDISKVKVYDSMDKELPYVEGENFRYYYFAEEKLPNNYRIYMNYEGKEYLLIDTNKRILDE